MNTEPLDVLPLSGVLLVALGLSLLVLEGGYRFGRWRHARVAEPEERPEAINAIILKFLRDIGSKQ